MAIANLPVQSPADVLNLGLRRMGYRLRVASLYDGSDAANQALDIYAQTRDELLRDGDWGFAERNIVPTLLKSAPASYVPGVQPWNPAQDPPLGALFEYAYPNDCLKVRALRPVPPQVLNFDPQPFVWRIANDPNLPTPARVILSNVAAGALTYTGQVTDPTAWEADFIEAVASALARRLSVVLMNLQVAQVEAADEAGAHQVAAMQAG